MRVVARLLAADAVNFKTVFVDSGVFPAFAHSESRVRFFQHTQHGTANAGQLRGKNNPLSRVLKQVDVARCQCLRVQAQAGSGLIGVQSVGAHHAKVFAQSGAGQACQQGDKKGGLPGRRAGRG